MPYGVRGGLVSGVHGGYPQGGRNGHPPGPCCMAVEPTVNNFCVSATILSSMDVFGLVDTNNTCEGLSSFVVMEIRGVLLFELGFWLDSREFTASAFLTASMGQGIAFGHIICRIATVSTIMEHGEFNGRSVWRGSAGCERELFDLFRESNGYGLYWGACGSLYHFMSRWMDATVHAAVFHLHNKNYNAVRPPSFFDHDELNMI